MTKSYFPLLILIDNNKIVVNNPEEIPVGKSFTVLQTNYVERTETCVCSVPVGANFSIKGVDGVGTQVYIRIPEMVLYGPNYRFVTNCIVDKQIKDIYDPPDQVCDFVLPETQCEYWWPKR